MEKVLSCKICFAAKPIFGTPLPCYKLCIVKGLCISHLPAVMPEGISYSCTFKDMFTVNEFKDLSLTISSCKLSGKKD